MNTTKVDRIAETVKDAIIPTTVKDAIAYIEWALDKEYEALKAYYLVGMALLNGEFKAKELEAHYSKGNLSKMRKIAKAVTTNAKYAELYNSGSIHTFTDAYELAKEMTGTVATSRVTYLEDLQAKRAKLLAEIAEIEKAMKTAPKKPAKVAKKSK